MLLFITLVSSTKTHLRFTPDRIVLLLPGAFFCPDDLWFGGFVVWLFSCFLTSSFLHTIT